MAKVIVYSEHTDEEVPFLRGVLVQSLVSIGLSFEEAYKLAQTVRKALGGVDRVSSQDLRSMITTILETEYGPEVAQAFASPAPLERQTLVSTPTATKPFSVGILTRSLEACAIRHEQALTTAREVQSALQAEYGAEIDHLELRRVVSRNLLAHVSKSAAESYLSWRRFKDSGRPLIILLGGITGTGKSTLANELAFRLQVVRTQSTDMLREIVRGYLASEEVPTLNFSSFEAWRGLGAQQPLEGDAPSVDYIVAGFDSQFEIVRKGLEATISRAVKERLDLIIDGIHVLPPRLELKQAGAEAVLVSAILVIASRGILAQRLAGRGQEQPSRGAVKYLRHLDEIWQLQSHLVRVAEEGDIPLLYNWEMEETLFQMLTLVSQQLAAEYPVDVDAVL